MATGRYEPGEGSDSWREAGELVEVTEGNEREWNGTTLIASLGRGGGGSRGLRRDEDDSVVWRGRRRREGGGRDGVCWQSRKQFSFFNRGGTIGGMGDQSNLPSKSTFAEDDVASQDSLTREAYSYYVQPKSFI